MLRLLGSVWSAVTAIRASLYSGGVLRRRQLDRPVVSIGALSVGGDGKTPTTAAVCALLREAGFRPAILSRGYRRRGRGPLLVSSGDGNGPRVEWTDAGDEPFWLASVLPEVAVAVASRREQAAGLVTAAADIDLFVLDDGFQHVRVARDIDLLVVDPRAPFWTDAPMPAGRLRERPSAARRASAFLVSHEPTAETADRLEEYLPGGPKFAMSRLETRAWPVGAGFPLAATSAPIGGDDGQLPGPALAFAGIARPQRFFIGLEDAGVELAGTVSFSDHHAFTTADIERLAATAHRAGAATLVTTEKDAVRLPNRLPEIPLHVWGYRLRFADSTGFLAWLTEEADLDRGAIR